MALALMAKLIFGEAIRCCLDCRTHITHRICEIGNSMLHMKSCSLCSLRVMETFAPQPLYAHCNSALNRATDRTSTGKRSRLTCCLQADDSVHISVVGSCRLATVVLGIPPVSSSQIPSNSSPANSATMPRLRQRMRCRRGPSRSARRPSPSPSSSPSDSSSHSDCLPRLLRGRLLRSGRRLDSPSGDALPAQSHTALFSFDCALNRPRVTVAISVVFLEEPIPETPPEEPVPDAGTHMNQMQHSVGSQPEASGAALQTDSVRVHASVAEAAHHNDDFPHDHSNPDDYSCRIEEVPPDE